MATDAQGFIDEFKLLECIQCGVCTGGCPVSAKAGLNIRQLMREIKFKGDVEIPPEEVLWSCTTCSTCEARCPKELTPYEVLVGMRGITVEEGRVAPTIRDALESVFKHGNPGTGRGASGRSGPRGSTSSRILRSPSSSTTSVAPRPTIPGARRRRRLW